MYCLICLVFFLMSKQTVSFSFPIYDPKNSRPLCSYCWISTADKSLSSGWRYPTFKQLGPGLSNIVIKSWLSNFCMQNLNSSQKEKIISSRSQPRYHKKEPTLSSTGRTETESITCLKSVGRKNNLVSTRDFDKQGQEAYILSFCNLTCTTL